jgi:sugar phosphate isomerase/epimerase
VKQALSSGPDSEPNILGRREFLFRAGGLLAASELLSSCIRLSSASVAPQPAAGTRSVPRFGLQLYTVRHLMTGDSEGTLAAVAHAGYSEVEFAGFYGHTARDMRSWLDKLSLTSPAGHISIEDIRSKWSQLVDDAHTLGWEWIICPWIDQPDRTPDGYRRIAAEFNTAGVAARRAGLRFAYHNHEFDFKPFADGSIPYDLMLSELDPTMVDMELDLFWIVKGGGDPLKYFARYPGRFPLVHVKDMTALGEMADVGQGAIDFRSIFAAPGAAGIRHFLVEHDDPKNPIADITASSNYLKALRF